MFSSTYHHQIDEEIKVVNKSLENFRKCLVGDKPKQWDLILLQVEFSHIELVNKNIGKTPFKIVVGYSPRGILELRELANTKGHE